MKLIQYALLAIANMLWLPLHAQAAGTDSLEKTLTGNRWDVDRHCGCRLLARP